MQTFYRIIRTEKKNFKKNRETEPAGDEPKEADDDVYLKTQKAQKSKTEQKKEKVGNGLNLCRIRKGDHQYQQ